MNLNEDQEEQLVYVINPSQARGQKVKFKSTNTSVATVDENGVVKGIKAGKAIIIASLSNGVATGCIVNVNGFEFKDLSTFLTPDEFNMPVKEKCGFQASAVDSGLYLYSYQIATKTYTENPDNDAKWKNASHVEYEIWNGDLGYGWGGTYVAMWQDGSYYINNGKNVKELRTKVIFTDLENGTIKIEYLMFIGFDNNVNSNVNKSDKSSLVGFILGLVSIAAWIIPLFGYPVTICGIIFSAKGLKSINGKGKAIAGLILSITFLIASFINSIIGVIISLEA